MADLTGKTVKSTYKDLLKIDSDVGGTTNSGLEDGVMKDVTDGEGQSSALSMSTTKVRIENLDADTADIDGGTIDGSKINSTPIGDTSRSTGEFSSVGVGGAKNTIAQTKIHDADTKTTLQMGEVIFEKTGVISAHVTTKNSYDWLQIEIHDETTAGSFLVEVEAIVTSGRDGSLPWGTDDTVTPLGAIAATYSGDGSAGYGKFTSVRHGLSNGDSVGLYNFDAAQPSPYESGISGQSWWTEGNGQVVVLTEDTFQILGLHTDDGYGNGDSGHFKATSSFQSVHEIALNDFIPDGKKFSYMKSTVIGMHRRIDGTESVVPAGSGASPYKHKIVWPDKPISWNNNPDTSVGFLCGTHGFYRPEVHRSLYAYKDPGTAYNFGESSEDKGNSATAGASYIGQDGVNILADNSYGIKYPKNSDMYNWVTHNIANPTGHDKVDSQRQPVWGNNDSFDNDGANTNGGFDGSWGAITERTWEPYFWMVEPVPSNTYWQLRLGTTSGYYGAEDGDAHQVLCISYKIKVISSWGSNGNAYVKGITTSNWAQADAYTDPS